MVATGIFLRDFRNYGRAEVELGPGLNVVGGPNGAGKTNLLEALHFACTARSCRTSSERELIRFGSQVARVVLEVESAEGTHVLEVALAREGGKRLRVDGARVDSLAEREERPLASVFLPDRLELVKGAPALRRAHLDRLVAALWPARAATRAAYGRTLAQRNALLARMRARGAATAAGTSLDAWDAKLAAVGVELMSDRAAAAELLAPAFAGRARELGAGGEPAVGYRPRSHAADADALREELRERRAADAERGFTAHGPHRDELALSRDGRPLRAYGSQGEQRLALLALLLAERDVLLAERGRPPLMLLDDVLSELDARRRERLVEVVLAGGQAVLTTTDAERVPLPAGADAAAIEVREGAIAGAGVPARPEPAPPAPASPASVPA